MDRIQELEREIELKKAELASLKKQKHLNFDVYNNFQKEKYGSYSIGAVLNAELRSLVTRVVSIKEQTRTYDLTKYLTSKQKARTKDMTEEELLFCNNLLRDLYPIIEKYTIEVLSKEQKRKEKK